jgi:membrane protease YdiL (CAAX protease family)
LLLPLVLAFALAVSMLLVFLHERHQLFGGDRFPNPVAKWLAYLWLTMLIVLMSVLVATASSAAASRIDTDQLTFWSLFTFHLVLVVFLIGWWGLSGMPPLSQFLNIRRDDRGQAVLLGLGVGVAGWAITIVLAMGIGMILAALDLLPQDLRPSPLIPWMAGLPVWQKAALVASAMTVEEAFFRGWLQKRVGLIASTLVFALAHSGYGQPIMLIGVTIVSLVIGYTFYQTRNLIPCVIAHGVFDAIQLFVVVPLALRFLQG